MDADTSALVPPKPWSFDELDWLSGVRTRFNREDTVRRLVALGEEDTKEEVHFFLDQRLQPFLHLLVLEHPATFTESLWNKQNNYLI